MTYQDRVNLTAKLITDQEAPSDVILDIWDDLFSQNIPFAEAEILRTRNMMESLMRQAVPWKETAIMKYLNELGLIKPETT